MHVRLDGKIAVVTGASRGVGKAIAVRLARHGATVALGARNQDNLRAVEREIVEQGGAARAFPLDVSQPDSAHAFSQAVREHLGTPSILINNAAVFGQFKLLHESDPARWAETITVNVLGTYYVTRAFLPMLRGQAWGRIVNVSSAAGIVPPMPALSAYQTSKAAMNQLTRGLAAELEGTGLTANAIHPGEVLTEMWDDIRREVAGSGAEGDGMRDWIRTLEELGGDPPEKAADLVLRLLAAEADGINGHFYFIEDGILGVLPTWSEPPPLPR